MDERFRKLAESLGQEAGKAAKKAGEKLTDTGSKAAMRRGLLEEPVTLEEVVDGFRSLSRDGTLDKDELRRRGRHILDVFRNRNRS